MSPEHSPARAGASCSAPDASLTIDEFCQAEKISRSSRSRTLFFVRRQAPRLEPELTESPQSVGS
jgi:hypothetical protein